MWCFTNSYRSIAGKRVGKTVQMVYDEVGTSTWAVTLKGEGERRNYGKK